MLATCISPLFHHPNNTWRGAQTFNHVIMSESPSSQTKVSELYGPYIVLQRQDI